MMSWGVPYHSPHAFVTYVVVANAVMDALSSCGIRHLDTPLSPEKIWRALHGEGTGEHGMPITTRVFWQLWFRCRQRSFHARAHQE